MRRLYGILVLLAFLALPAAAQPRAECVVPAKAGGGFDLTCLLLQDLLRQQGGAPGAAVDIRYLPGGIGAVAFDRAVTQRWSEPRTVVAFSTGSLLNLAQGKFGRHSVDEVQWLATLGTEYGVVAVRRNSPITSLASLRARLQSDAAGVVFGAGGGVGSQDWFKAALLVRGSGRDHRAMRFVSFEGGGQALAALRGGHVEVFCGDAAEATRAVLAGDIRLLAVLSPRRLPGPLSQVATAREQGVDLVWPTVRGLYMGPGVSPQDYEEWTRTLRRAMASPEFAKLAAARGMEPSPLVGGAVKGYVRAEVERMRELAYSLRLTPR